MVSSIGAECGKVHIAWALVEVHGGARPIIDSMGSPGPRAVDNRWCTTVGPHEWPRLVALTLGTARFYLWPSLPCADIGAFADDRVRGRLPCIPSQARAAMCLATHFGWRVLARARAREAWARLVQRRAQTRALVADLAARATTAHYGALLGAWRTQAVRRRRGGGTPTRRVGGLRRELGELKDIRPALLLGVMAA